jgi:hypothetical protein
MDASTPASVSEPLARWAPGDDEAIRQALSLPLSEPVLLAIEAAMAAVAQLQPTAISAVQQCLQDIAALDQRLAALTPEQCQHPLEIQRKGARPDVLNAALTTDGELPVRKADVIEYATELLLEESTTRFASGTLSVGEVLLAQRKRLEQALLLMLPSLVSWRERLQPRDPFTAVMARS